MFWGDPCSHGRDTTTDGNRHKTALMKSAAPRWSWWVCSNRGTATPRGETQAGTTNKEGGCPEGIRDGAPARLQDRRSNGPHGLDDGGRMSGHTKDGEETPSTSPPPKTRPPELEIPRAAQERPSCGSEPSPQMASPRRNVREAASRVSSQRHPAGRPRKASR